LGELDLARENATQAHELRARVTEVEQLAIDARYYAYVTGELEKVAQVHTLEVQNYPESPGAYNHLGISDGELARYEQSVEDLRKALVLDPGRANTYANLALDLVALNRVDDASTVLKQAGDRNLKVDGLLQAGYWIAFLRDDVKEMERLLQESADVSGAASLLLNDQSNTEAYHGHFAKARELSRSAANLLEKDDDRESAAKCLAQAAVREAEVGNSAGAREFIIEAQKLSRGQDVTTLIALTLARIGDAGQAETLCRELNQEWPLGTYVQKYWLPLIQGEIDLRAGRASKAVDDLSVATAPLEFSAPPATILATLYPAYVRGQAYLASDDSRAAIAEFQKLIDHKGLLVNYPLGPLARLGLARAYARSGDIPKARQAYHEFLELWKTRTAIFRY
jgi:eukaryotic-like serine/threonine-protein kinase